MNQRRVGRNRKVPTGTFTVADDGTSSRSTPPGELGAGTESLPVQPLVAASSPSAPNTLIGMTAVPQALLEEARARRGSHLSPPSYEQVQASLSAREGTAIIRPEELQPLDDDDDDDDKQAIDVDADELGAVVQEASSVIDALESPFIGIEDAELDRELRAGTGPLSWDPGDGPVPWEVVRSAQGAGASGVRPQGLWSEEERLDAELEEEELAEDDLADVDLEDTEISVVEHLEIEGGAARGDDGVPIPIELSEGDLDHEVDGMHVVGSSALPVTEDDRVDEDEVTQVVALSRHGRRPVHAAPAEVPDFSPTPDVDEPTGSETLQAFAQRAGAQGASAEAVSYPPVPDGMEVEAPPWTSGRGESTGMVVHRSARPVPGEDGMGGPLARLWRTSPIPVMVGAGIVAVLLLAAGVWAMWDGDRPDTIQAMNPVTDKPMFPTAAVPVTPDTMPDAPEGASPVATGPEVESAEPQSPELEEAPAAAPVDQVDKPEPEAPVAAQTQAEPDRGPGARPQRRGARNSHGEKPVARGAEGLPLVERPARRPAADGPARRPAAERPARRPVADGPRAEAARRNWSDVPAAERPRWNDAPGEAGPQPPAERRREVSAASPKPVLDDEYFFPSDDKLDAARAKGADVGPAEPRGAASAAAVRRVEQRAEASGSAAEDRNTDPFSFEGGGVAAGAQIEEIEVQEGAATVDGQQSQAAEPPSSSSDGSAVSVRDARSMPPGTAPSAAEVAAAIEEVRIRAESCVSDRHAEVVVDGTLAPDGRVSHALISGEFAGTAEGSCLARAIRAARLAPFTGEPTKFRYRFEL